MARGLVLTITCDAGKGTATRWKEVFPVHASAEPLVWLMSRLDAAVEHAVSDGPLAIETLTISVKWPGLVPRSLLRQQWRDAAETIFNVAGPYDDEIAEVLGNPFSGHRVPEPPSQARPSTFTESDCLEILPEEGGTDGQA